jgi:hypothetical protein
VKDAFGDVMSNLLFTDCQRVKFDIFDEPDFFSPRSDLLNRPPIPIETIKHSDGLL